MKKRVVSLILVFCMLFSLGAMAYDVKPGDKITVLSRRTFTYNTDYSVIFAGGVYVSTQALKAAIAAKLSAETESKVDKWIDVASGMVATVGVNYFHDNKTCTVDNVTYLQVERKYGTPIFVTQHTYTVHKSDANGAIIGHNYIEYQGGDVYLYRN